jgi:hypothetical protein
MSDSGLPNKDEWNNVVSPWFDSAIESEGVPLLAFASQASTPLPEQSIVWNALVNRYGRRQALACLTILIRWPGPTRAISG